MYNLAVESSASNAMVDQKQSLVQGLSFADGSQAPEAPYYGSFGDSSRIQFS